MSPLLCLFLTVLNCAIVIAHKMPIPTSKEQNPIKPAKNEDENVSEMLRNNIVKPFHIKPFGPERINFLLRKNFSFLRYYTARRYKRSDTNDKLLHLQNTTFTSNKVAVNTMKYFQWNDEKIRFENKKKMSGSSSDLHISDTIPGGEEMQISKLKLGERIFLFEVFSAVMGYIQPKAFPPNLIKAAVHNHVPFHLLVFQILKLEVKVLGWIVLWFILALSLPCVVAAKLCCPQKNIDPVPDDFSWNEVPKKWRRIFLSSLLHIFLIMILFCNVIMIASNEELSKALMTAPESVTVVLHDVQTFIGRTATEISFITTSTVQNSINSTQRNLDDVEELLGAPLLAELSSETGLNSALETLNDLKTATFTISKLVSNLLNECVLARNAGTRLQENLREVSRHLSAIRQQCLPRDRTLCDTLQFAKLEVTLNVEEIVADVNFKNLNEIGKDSAFNKSIDNVGDTFQTLPRFVSLETAAARADIAVALKRHGDKVYESVKSLENLSTSLTLSLSSISKDITETVESISSGDLWRWLGALGVSLLVFLTWAILFCGAPCGCEPTSKTIPFFLFGLILTCLLMIILWTFGTISFLVGGHGQALLCQSLYDTHYTTLGHLFDAGGIFYEKGGIFANVFKANDSIKIADVLRNCQRNRSAYTTFNLYDKLDVNTITNHDTWQDLKALFKNFSIDATKLNILTPTLLANLERLLTSSKANFTEYRSRMSQTLVTRDVNALADQLEIVSKQLGASFATSKMDNLAQRTRKLIVEEINPLKSLKDAILYDMVALEVMLIPMNKQTNQSLSRLKTIHFFIGRQGAKIAEKSINKYISRLKNHLSEMQADIKNKLERDLGKCKPLWDCFDGIRTILCKLIIDPMNAFSLSCFMCTLLFIGLGPVIIKLLEDYSDLSETSLTSITHRRSRNSIITDQEETWVSPSNDRNPAEHVEPPIERFWTASRQPSESHIPSPPRPPPELLARMPSPLILPSTAIPTKQLRERYQPLRMIEETTWRTPGSTPPPRNWM